MIKEVAHPGMVKAVYMVAPAPARPFRVSRHWHEVHGPLAAQVRPQTLCQESGAQAYALRPMTHDGFAEMWFDDLAALHRAQTQWAAYRRMRRRYVPTQSACDRARRDPQGNQRIPAR